MASTERYRTATSRAASPMTQLVALVVSHIPEGRVTTYGRIARAIGSPRSARIVGWTMSHLPESADAPAHRVVNRLGELSGAHAWGHPEIMRDLLMEEDIPFVGEWQVDLAACVWDPSDDDLLMHRLELLRATG